MELSDYARIFARRWKIVFGLTVLGIVVAAIVTVVTPSKYAAEARLFVGSSSGAQSSASAFAASQYISQRMSSYTELDASGRVLKPVIDSLGLNESVHHLAQFVSVTNPSGTVVLNVTVTDTRRSRAIDIANAVARQLSSVIQQLESSGTAASRFQIKVTITENASSAGGPVSPKPALNLGLGLLIGLVVGALVAILRDQLDRSVRSVADVGAVVDLPVLAAIPYSRRVRRGGMNGDVGEVLEACRGLRANLSIVLDTFPRTVTVLSPDSGDGRSSVAALFATSLARAGVRTCLVEADFRRPALATVLQVRSFPGLVDVLDGSATLDESIVEYESNGFVLAAGGIGKADVTALLETTELDDTIRELADRFDAVVVDVPPAMSFADGLLVARRTQATLLVARPGKTNREALRATVPALAGARGTVAGVVLAAARSRSTRRDLRYPVRPVAVAMPVPDPSTAVPSLRVPSFVAPDQPWTTHGGPPRSRVARHPRRRVPVRPSEPTPSEPPDTSEPTPSEPTPSETTPPSDSDDSAAPAQSSNSTNGRAEASEDRDSAVEHAR